MSERRFTGILMVVAFFFFCAVFAVAWAGDGEFSTRYVPKRAYRDVYIPTELVMPAPQASPRAKATMWALRNALSDYVRPQENETVGASGCTVQVQQLGNTDPTYWIECRSEVPSATEPVFKEVGHYDDSAKVLEKIREFSRKHFERTRQSILRRTKGPLQIT